MVLNASTRGRERSPAKKSGQASGFPAATFGDSQSSLEKSLLQTVDACLAAVIFLVPMLMGGRHALGQLALTAAAVTAAVAWTVRQSLRGDARWWPTAASPLLLLGVALLVLQITPLPSDWLMRLSPRVAEILPLWRGPGAESLGRWSCVSLAPAETTAALVIFLDYALLFLVAVQRIRRVEDVERLLRWCAMSAVLMASFGLVQLAASNGKFFWFYEHPLTGTSDAAKGSFSNRNHFAQFLALGIGPLIWWLQDAVRRSRERASRHQGGVPVFGVRTLERSPRAAAPTGNWTACLLGLALVVVLFAGLLSLSRGGIAVIFLAAAACSIICWRTASLGGRFVAMLLGAGLLIGGLFCVFGLDRVSARLDDFSSGSLDRLDRGAVRRTVWATTLSIAPNYLAMGTGAGSFSDVFPMYSGLLADRELDICSENSYLPLLLETGVGGAAICLAALSLCVLWCAGGLRPSAPTRLRVCAAAATVGLAASAAHALTDFVWYVPACMAMVVLLAACALRVRDLTHSSHASRPLPRFVWMSAAACVACLGVWMVGNRIGPALAQPYFDEYLVQYRKATRQASRNVELDAIDAPTLRQWIQCLEAAVDWQPTHVQAHLRLAETHLWLFEQLQQTEGINEMPLKQIADAVVHSDAFSTREALTEWLSTAVGPHWKHLELAWTHARRAVALGPLRGRAYACLADLTFLRGDKGSLRRACLSQALWVRPFDGAVLYAIAQEALLTGDAQTAMAYAKAAFQTGPRQREKILGAFVASTPQENMPGMIESILREFQPDLNGSRFLYAACAKICQPEQLTSLAAYRAKQAKQEAERQTGVKAAGVWFEAHRLYAQIGNEDEADRCIDFAIRCDPGNYDAHYALGLRRLKPGTYAEAETHLRWCLQRSPRNQTVESRLHEAVKGRLEDDRRAAKETERR